MANISINLLPAEVREQNLKNRRFLKIQAIGVASILVMFFLASTTVALRILQSQSVSQIQNKLTQSEQKVSLLKDTQASLYILKNRLAAIDQVLGTSSNPTLTYRLITQLLPPSVSISSVSVDQSSESLILLTIPDAQVLDNVIANLTSKESNQGKIEKVTLENINRGKDGVYRVSLKIKAKI